MGEPICIKDFEAFACKKLPQNIWTYYRMGESDEQTLKDNISAFKRYRLRPTILHDVSSVDISTSVLGSKISFPVCISSTAMNKMVHPDGEIAVAKAAASMGTGYMLASLSNTSIEDVANETVHSLRWMQIYIYKDREITRQQVRKAEDKGYKAIFLTVDTLGLSKKTDPVRNSFVLPPGLKLANFGGKSSGQSTNMISFVNSIANLSLQWSDIKWLRSITKLPIVLKGILTGEMAEKAVEHGVDGILVSNHGGRHFDGVPAAIDALGEVVAAVNGRCEVYMDSGIRTGTDVLKALALGARAVFIGRPAIWGLAYDGEEGVKKVLTILRDEFRTSLQLLDRVNTFVVASSGTGYSKDLALGVSYGSALNPFVTVDPLIYFHACYGIPIKQN